MTAPAILGWVVIPLSEPHFSRRHDEDHLMNCFR